MWDFFANNIAWLFRYFEKSKHLLEILSLFFVLQTFLYQPSLSNSGLLEIEIKALKLVFWIFILISSFLLYVQSELNYSKEEDDNKTSVFYGSVLGKYTIRLLIYIIFSTVAVITVREITMSFSNHYFVIFWTGLLALIIIETIRKAGELRNNKHMSMFSTNIWRRSKKRKNFVKKQGEW